MRTSTATCLLVVASLLAAGCGQRSSADQTVRTCVDRWNQGNMAGWEPAAVNVAFRRPVAKERASIVMSPGPQCIVSIDAGDGTWTCLLTGSGAYWCPPLHEPTGPRLTNRNGAIERRGVLVLDSPLNGTHPAPPLAWQRYPHIDGFIEPWTADGTLRAGLRFTSKGHGPCVVVDETAVSAISCLAASGGRYDACFPKWQDWLPGEMAACGGLGDTTFTRWRITGVNEVDPQILRSCVDRWNQGNMISWGPTQAGVGVAVLRVKGGERSHCVVALAVGYKRKPGNRCYDHLVPGHPDYCFRRSATYVCVAYAGAYACPPNAEGSPPLRRPNATVEVGGKLTLQASLKGTHPTPALAWQRYPHVDGFVEPWTADGKLRADLRFTGADRGPCFLVAETVTSGISCLTARGARYDACFPQSRPWRAGELAACGALGATDFVRWTITQRR